MNFLDFSSYDTDTWTTFLQENWLVLVIGLIVLLLVIRIVKTVMKWAIVALVVVGLVLYSGYTLDDVKEIGTKVVDTVKNETADAVKKQALELMLSEVKEAKYTVNNDGMYTVKSKNIELKGKTGDSQVKVSLHGAPSITLETEGAIQQFIDQAKKNG